MMPGLCPALVGSLLSRFGGLLAGFAANREEMMVVADIRTHRPDNSKFFAPNIALPNADAAR